MNIARRWVLTAVLAGSMVGGGVGAAIMNATSSSAATGNSSTATVPTTSAPTAAAPSGTFKPNENASHESGESAQREAQEDAGQFPTVP